MNASFIFGSYEEIKTRQQYIPENYLNLPSPPATGVGITLVGQFRQDEVIPKVAVLWAVHSGEKRFRTSKPIQVHVFRDDDLFFAENENLLVCGTGDSAWEAVEDLELHIIHFWKYYSKLSSDRVIGDAKRLKALYKNLLIEEQ